MEFKAAKCTQCGADIQVDSTKEAANCEFCGSAFIVEKAINNYNIENAQINAGTVNVSMGTTSQRLKENAEKSLEVGQYKNAYLDFKKAIELNKSDYEAYWGICRVHMAELPKLSIGLPITETINHNQDFLYYCRYGNSFYGENIYEIYDCAIAYAPKEKADEYKLIAKSHNRKYEYAKAKHDEINRRNNKIGLFGILLIVVGIVIFGATLFGGNSDFLFDSFLIGGALSLVGMFIIKIAGA